MHGARVGFECTSRVTTHIEGWAEHHLLLPLLSLGVHVIVVLINPTHHSIVIALIVKLMRSLSSLSPMFIYIRSKVPLQTEIFNITL